MILAYLSGLFILGVYFSRRQTSEETYFLGGRRIPWLLAGISVLATLLSTISYLSLPGEMIRYGIGFFTAFLSIIAIVPVVNRIIIPSLMRLPVTSVYEYLEGRFGQELRALAALTFIFTRLLWVGLIIYTASFAVSAMTDWSIPAIILTIGLVTIFYTTSGGMTAVIWSDFAQFIILLGGALFIPLYVAFQTGTGPFAWWVTFSHAGRAAVPVFSLDPTVRITIVGMVLLQFVWHVCTHGADQVAAQRYLSTPSTVAAQHSVWVFSVANIFLILLLMVSGLALFSFNFHSSTLSLQEFQAEIATKADRILPEFIATELPVGVSGLLLAALLAAAMSSFSSGINSISTVAVTDFFRRFGILKKYQGTLALPMILAVAAGGFGMGTALVVNRFMKSGGWNLLELMERANHLFVAPLGALFLAGILFRRVGREAALIGFVAGSLSSILISFSKELFELERGISFMWIMPAALVVSLLVSYTFGLLFKPPSESQLASLTRGAGK